MDWPCYWLQRTESLKVRRPTSIAFEPGGRYAAHRVNGSLFAHAILRIEGAAGPIADQRDPKRVIGFDERKEKMTIKKVEIERYSVTSGKSFEAVVTALEAVVGHPDIVEFGKATKAARTSLNWRVRFRKGWAGQG
jgi:hypothetical protein